MAPATLLPAGEHWIAVRDGDDRARALYLRHYSAVKNKPFRRGGPLFVPPGQKFVLLSSRCDALFVWLHNTIQRWDKQTGVCCTVFRNESITRSSDLIEEACALAWVKWPGLRLWTYVNPDEIKSPNPGYCFKRAGFRFCGASIGGLHILERLPEVMP